MAPPRIAAVALLCLVGFAGIAVVAGAPPPTQLCGTCGSDVPGATGPGTLDIYVDSSGDSRWTERVPVNESTAALYREDSAALERAVENPEGVARYHVAEDDVTDREIEVENDDVVVTYTVEDVARPGVDDAWLVDYFVIESGNDRYQLAAERVTIHTPTDTVVTNDPRYADVDGNTATWTAHAEGTLESDFDRRTYVTYGSSGALGTASGYATIGLEVGPTALEQGVVAGIAPGILIAFAGFAVGRTDRGADAFDVPSLERLLVVVGAVGAVGLIGVSAAATGRPFSPGFGVLSALGVGYAALGIAARRSGYRRSTRGLTALAVLVTLGTGAMLWLLGNPSSVAVLPFGLATALFLPIGYAFEGRSRPLAPVLLAVLAPIAAAVAVSAVASPRGLGLVVYWLLLLFWAVAVAVFGYPLALLGRRLADESAEMAG